MSACYKVYSVNEVCSVCSTHTPRTIWSYYNAPSPPAWAFCLPQHSAQRPQKSGKKEKKRLKQQRKNQKSAHGGAGRRQRGFNEYWLCRWQQWGCWFLPAAPRSGHAAHFTRCARTVTALQSASCVRIPSTPPFTKCQLAQWPLATN